VIKIDEKERAFGRRRFAIKHLQRAKALFLKELGPNHPDAKKAQELIDKLTKK
jgi:hypothetical protein